MKPLPELLKEQLALHANAWIAARQVHVTRVREPQAIVELAVAAPAAFKLVAALLPDLAALPDLPSRRALLRAALDQTMPALLASSARAYRDLLVAVVMEETVVLSEILTMHGLLGDMQRLALSREQAARAAAQALADQAFPAWLQRSYGVYRGHLLSWRCLAPRHGTAGIAGMEAACRAASQAWARQLGGIARTCLHQAMDRARRQVMQSA
ncbi:MAG: hypothetical protein HY794_01850 [Desulfarculus sp.]|nr:hypothetical protein [Desulfarculus sp.]